MDITTEPLIVCLAILLVKHAMDHYLTTACLAIQLFTHSLALRTHANVSIIITTLHQDAYPVIQAATVAQMRFLV